MASGAWNAKVTLAALAGGGVATGGGVGGVASDTGFGIGSADVTSGVCRCEIARLVLAGQATVNADGSGFVDFRAVLRRVAFLIRSRIFDQSKNLILRSRLSKSRAN